MFLTKIKNRYKIVSSEMGYITKKELQEKVPQLAKAYEDTYSSKRPDIKVVAKEEFNFPAEQFSMGSWHVVYAMLNGQVQNIPVENYYGKTQKLLPGSMILDCLVGNLNMCYLYVHPQDASPLIKEGEELSENEYYALKVMTGYKPAFREKGFYEMKYGMQDYEAQQKNPAEYKEAIKSLVAKGLAKTSSSGAVQLTLEGKNRAVSAKKPAKKD